MKSVREAEYNDLYTVSENLNIPIEVIACGCYLVAYSKDGHFNSKLTYGWVLVQELLRVFEREDKKYVSVYVPKTTETVSISNNYLLVNEKKYMTINADDTDYVPVQFINGKAYALIHVRSEFAQAQEDIVADNNKIYNINMIYGFKYSSAISKEGWKDMVKANNYVFTVKQVNGKLVTIINGEIIAQIKATDISTLDSYELEGKTVKIVTSPAYAETEATIKNLSVKIVG